MFLCDGSGMRIRCNVAGQVPSEVPRVLGRPRADGGTSAPARRAQRIKKSAPYLAGAAIPGIWIKSARPTNDLARLGRKIRTLARLPIAYIGRIFPNQAEIQQLAKRVYVAAHVSLPKTELLGRGVPARYEMGGVGIGPLAPLASRSKIDDDRRAAAHENIGGLEVAVDERRVERLVQHRHGIAQAGHHEFGRLAARANRRHERAHRAPIDVFHYHREFVIVAAALDKTGDASGARALPLGIPQRDICTPGTHAHI